MQFGLRRAAPVISSPIHLFGKRIQYSLLNSSNKRACNRFVNVTLVSSTHIKGKKLKENVKRDTRKLLKHLKKKQFKNEKNNTRKTRTHSC